MNYFTAAAVRSALTLQAVMGITVPLPPQGRMWDMKTQSKLLILAAVLLPGGVLLLLLPLAKLLWRCVGRTPIGLEAPSNAAAGR